MSISDRSFNQENAKKPQEKISLNQRLAALRNLPQFFRLVWQTNPFLAISSLVLRIIKSAIPVAILYVGKLIIDQVVFLHRSPETSTTNNLWTLVALEFGLALVSDSLGRAINLLDSLLGDLFANHTSVRIMEHAATLDLDQFEDSAFYDKLERARQQTVGRTVLLSQVMSQLQDFITMVFLGAGLVTFNPWLIVLLLVAILPAFLGESYFNDQGYALSRRQTPERRELDYMRYIGASDETAKEVKIFNLSEFLVKRFRDLSSKFYAANKKLAVRRAGWGTFFTMIGSIGYYAAYVIIIRNTISGKLSIGDLTFLAGSFRQLKSLLETILSRFNSVSQGAIYLTDLFEFFLLQPKIYSHTSPRPFPTPIKEGFVFKNVGFKYLNADKWAIRNLDFTLKAAEKIALVGENGAGKTTLVKLLARLYEPTEGNIFLDGHDLREYDLVQLRMGIGVIFQDFLKYQMTASQNIAVGNIVEEKNQIRIRNAAKSSLADSVIERFPSQYEQALGRRFNDGIELSGGEWQKVALARAYMRDAQVLILDEPTAALDARAEYTVFQRFADLTRGKTAVLISHRFSTVRMADRILVLEKGQLVEIGTHQELINKNGKYAELFNLQAIGYR